MSGQIEKTYTVVCGCCEGVAVSDNGKKSTLSAKMWDEGWVRTFEKGYVCEACFASKKPTKELTRNNVFGH
jgi:hypothetical protein